VSTADSGREGEVTVTDEDVEALIESMCLTWRHDFGLPYDPDEAKAWGNTGPTPSEKDALRRRMRQLYEHHIKPLLEAYASRKGEAAHPPSADAEGLRKLIGEVRDAIAFVIGNPDSGEWPAAYSARYIDDTLAALAQSPPEPGWNEAIEEAATVAYVEAVKHCSARDGMKLIGHSVGQGIQAAIRSLKKPEATQP
jgi:hypothetical protein